jgi:hypothetical protein
LDHFLYEDSEDKNSDSDKEFLGFHKREDSEDGDSDFTEFLKVRYISLFDF